MFSRLVISLSPAFSNHIVFVDFRNFCVSRFWNNFSFIHFNVPGADSAVTYKGVGCDHSGIVFMSQAANVSDYMPRKRAATAIWYGLSYTVIAQSGNLEVWHPESGIGVGAEPREPSAV